MTGTAGAQARPDFTGEWVHADTTRPSIASRGDGGFRSGDMGSGWGSPLTIAQRDKELVVSFDPFSAYDLQPPLRLVYSLDDSTSTNSIMIGYATTTQRSRAEWRGQTLVIITTQAAPDAGDGHAATVEMRQVLALESPRTLVIETTRPDAPGAPPNVTRTTYTRR